MSYPDDLIDQAKQLAPQTAGRGRPKQVDLRRSVSASYYAMFHAVVDRAVSSVLSGPQSNGPVGARMRRTVSHANAAKAAKWFLPGSTPPAEIQAMLPPHPSKDLVSVCEAFSDLQSARHEADYDLSVPILRREAIRRWTDAETALKKFRTLQRSDELTVFVLGCLLGEALKKNS